MPSDAITTFQELDLDVTNLLSLHPASARTPGRPKGDTGPLLRSTVVLLCTAWENYVERAVAEAFTHVLTTIGDDHTKLLGRVRHDVQTAGKADPWSMTGLQWKKHAQTLIDKQLSDLNNAGPGQVNGLLHYAFGFSDFLADISWKGQAVGKVDPELVELVNNTRGDIVHQGKTSKPLRKNSVERWQRFMSQLVKSFDVKLAAAIEDAYGSPPWQS